MLNLQEELNVDSEKRSESKTQTTCHSSRLDNKNVTQISFVTPTTYIVPSNSHMNTATSGLSTKRNPVMPDVDPTVPPSVQTSHPIHDLDNDNRHQSRDSVDSWIDALDPAKDASHFPYPQVDTNFIGRLAILQSLPRIDITTFDGSALEWLNFVVEFKEVIHDQSYIS